ncbi:hypothetical protein Cadr_000014020, partial [Camelus dromedarius]
ILFLNRKKKNPTFHKVFWCPVKIWNPLMAVSCSLPAMFSGIRKDPSQRSRYKSPEEAQSQRRPLGSSRRLELTAHLAQILGSFSTPVPSHTCAGGPRRRPFSRNTLSGSKLPPSCLRRWSHITFSYSVDFQTL